MQGRRYLVRTQDLGTTLCCAVSLYLHDAKELLTLMSVDLGIVCMHTDAWGMWWFAGVIVGGAVPPLACLLLWKRCTAAAAISGTVTVVLPHVACFQSKLGLGVGMQAAVTGGMKD